MAVWAIHNQSLLNGLECGCYVCDLCLLPELLSQLDSVKES